MPVEPDSAREEEFESRWEAAPAVAVILLMQALLGAVSADQHWKLWRFPWWVWLIAIVPELVLLASLAADGMRQRLEQIGQEGHTAGTADLLTELESALGSARPIFDRLRRRPRHCWAIQSVVTRLGIGLIIRTSRPVPRPSPSVKAICLASLLARSIALRIAASVKLGTVHWGLLLGSVSVTFCTETM